MIWLTSGASVPAGLWAYLQGHVLLLALVLFGWLAALSLIRKNTQAWQLLAVNAWNNLVAGAGAGIGFLAIPAKHGLPIKNLLYLFLIVYVLCFLGTAYMEYRRLSQIKLVSKSGHLRPSDVRKEVNGSLFSFTWRITAASGFAFIFLKFLNILELLPYEAVYLLLASFVILVFSLSIIFGCWLAPYCFATALHMRQRAKQEQRQIYLTGE